MAKSYKFYVPVGVVSLAAAPSAPEVGDTYFDTVLKQLRSWDGSAWIAAAPGSVGPTGPQGIAGTAGAVGPTGPQGAAGTAGTTGPTGPTGPQGVAGTTGAVGPPGPTAVSANTGNLAKLGTDNLLFVPHEVLVQPGQPSPAVDLWVDTDDESAANLFATTAYVDSGVASAKSYADALIWSGTQAQYDALGSKDPNVLYVVTG